MEKIFDPEIGEVIIGPLTEEEQSDLDNRINEVTVSLPTAEQ